MEKLFCERVHLDEVDSTNRYALDNYENLSDFCLITSSTQTGGRGRRGRKWISPPGVNLYASLLIKNFPFPIFHSSWIGSLGVLKTLRQNLGELSEDKAPWLKWPNDIYCGHKKISGILCEVKSNSFNKIDGVVIGMGVNVNYDSESLLTIDQPATSILDITGKTIDVKKISKQLANTLTTLYSTTLLSSTIDLYTDWKKENKLLEKNIEVIKEDGSIIKGVVLDFGQNGELVLETDDKSTLILHSGDISIKKNFKI